MGIAQGVAEVMKMLDLFSGIGGFSLAASWAGIETVAFCEKDGYCQKVLKKHWPLVPVVDDIFKLRGDEFGPVDIVSGGFPCQPFSVAGKRKGKEDDRHLWTEMFRVIKTARPTWVLGENVAGIISMELDQVLSDLAGAGYATQAMVIPACGVDAPHRRDRVWIVAHSESNRARRRQCEICQTDGRQRDTLPREFIEPSSNVANSVAHGQDQGIIGGEREPRDDEGKSCQRGNNPRISREDDGCKNVAYSQGKQGHREGSVRLPSITTQCRQDVGNTDMCGCKKPGLQFTNLSTKPSEDVSDPQKTKFKRNRNTRSRGNGFANIHRWPVEPNVGRVAHGIPKRVDRLKVLGNSIVPQVAFQIFKAMVDNYESAQ
jgi:DNA (cytosine-5)-methyltransferase 1